MIRPARAFRSAGQRAIGFALLTLAITAGAAPATVTPYVPAKTHQLGLQTPTPSGRVIVKLAADAGVTVTPGGLAVAARRVDDPLRHSAGGDNARATAAAARLESLLSREAPGARFERRFSRAAGDLDTERLAAQSRTGLRLPDLNLYAQIDAGGLDRDGLLALVRALLADRAVETAFLEPVAEPAVLGFGSAGGGGTAVKPAGRDLQVTSTTPDFTGLQGYLDVAPLGVGAHAVDGLPGARGDGVKVIDIEGAWLWTHEDLTAPFVELGPQVTALSWRNHGTAVMGVMRGEDNGYGVRGIVPNISVGGASIAEQSVADAISNATAELTPGDIILIELHAPGPNYLGFGQFGYVPMEFWQDNFDAIVMATAAGVIVCEAAGNGQQNLDDPVYLGLFDRAVRDSGAIMCGASNGSSLSPAWFSNNGQRVDLHGWGMQVTTAGYGVLQGEPLPETEWYTDQFNGTSSASPIVVGAVASLQGMVKQALGFPLDARLARDILRATGTPQAPGNLIGPRPNIVAAWALAAGGIGRVTGVVTDATTSLPVPDVYVTVTQTGAFDLTSAAGSYGFPLLSGGYDLTFESFFYTTRSEAVTITSGATAILNVALSPVPTLTIAGRVYDTGGTPLSGVRVTPLGVPLAPTQSGGDGGFAIGGVPEDRTYTLLFDGKPGYGADVRQMSTHGAGAGVQVPVFQELPAAAQTFEASDGGFLSSDPAVWSHGIPAGGSGPASGFSGLRCWGIGMDGNGYADLQSGTLESPAYDFSAASVLFLSLHYWCATEPGFDGVNLEVSAGSGWVTVHPLSGYTDVTLGGLAYQPGWSGDSGGWRGAVFDLTPHIGASLRFRLVFGADAGVTGPGFWIDDIAFDTGDVITAVGSDDEVDAGGRGGSGKLPSPARLTLTAHPNPFNPVTVIVWRGAVAGLSRAEIFDMRGRLVRRVSGGEMGAGAGGVQSGAIAWDGRDDAGRQAPSGAYLVRALDGAARTATLRIVLTK